MADETALSFSVASVVEDVLNRSQGLDLDSRRAQEAGILATFLKTLMSMFFYVIS